MATASDFPKEFDVVVLGTGMPESIIAAAFSRIGQSVLHLDRNDHYSGNWASFNLQGIEKWAEQQQEHTHDLERPVIDESSLLEEGEQLVQLPLGNTSFSNTEVQYYVQEQDEEDIENVTNKAVPVVDKQANKVGNEVESDIDDSGELVTKVEGKSEESNVEINSETSPFDDKDNLSEIKPGNDEQEMNTENKDKESETKADTDSKKTSNQSGENNDEPKHENVTENTASTDTVVATEEKAIKTWTQKRLKADWRKFNLDLSPKVLYSVGDMVELLISSDIAKYCEFKTVTQVLTLMDGKLEKVPCSRADVFSSKKVSMLEKRMLMKFLQFCLEYEKNPETVKDFVDKPFTEFLSSRKLTPTIKHYIQHSIAMVTDSMTTSEGLTRMKKFLSSLGRYGNTAFLWSLYGSGELPQSFCRMCAVFGGVYCLRMSASSMIIDSENRCNAIVTTEGQRIKCKWLIMESSYAPKSFIQTKEGRQMSRAIIMSDRPLLTDGSQEQLSVMCLPCTDDGDRPVNILELPPSSMAAPRGVYICHLTRLSTQGVKPKDDLTVAVQSLFSEEDGPDSGKPRLLWSLYFTQDDLSDIIPSSTIPVNVILMSGPGTSIDIDNTVLEAKNVFKRILPDEEFLPKAPNPEDIIYVDDTEAQVADADSQSEFSKTDQSETQEGKQDNQLDASKTDQDSLTDQSESEVQEENPDSQSGASIYVESGSEGQVESKKATDHASNNVSDGNLDKALQKQETSPSDIEQSVSEMDINKDKTNDV